MTLLDVDAVFMRAMICMMTLLDVDVVAMRAMTFRFFGIIEQSFGIHSYSVLKSTPSKTYSECCYRCIVVITWSPAIADPTQ